MRGSCSEIPPCRGVYVYLFQVEEGLEAAVGGLGPQRFPPGVYAYVGSARGPGGVRARVCRHMAREKRLRWHIDYVSARAEPVGVFYSCDSDCSEGSLALECSRLLTPWIRGFGSSDDSVAETHLYRCRGLRECLEGVQRCFEAMGCSPAYRLLARGSSS
ncbi:MAG: GIY-YIG nuclease family protein [Desulfurococcales archaeon]|nr:GIY-YIG nuclease family protein [Desulfurococcales archaeon]